MTRKENNNVGHVLLRLELQCRVGANESARRCPVQAPVRFKTRSYRILYDLLGPLLRGLYRRRPGSMTTTANVGGAMLNLARQGWPEPILDGNAINAAAQYRPRVHLPNGCSATSSSATLQTTSVRRFLSRSRGNRS